MILETLTLFGLGATVLLGVGVARQVRAYNQRRRRPLPPPDDPRWSSAAEEQIVGRECAHCSKRFVLQKDAVGCSHCTRYVHARLCAREHLMHTHLAKRNVPYR